MKRKNSRLKRYVPILVLLLLIMGLVGVTLHSVYQDRYPPLILVEETVLIDSAERISSQNEYGGNVGRNNGYVSLDISGFGTLTEGIFFDAFYVFDSDNQIIGLFNDFYLNSMALMDIRRRSMRPYYNENHEYIISWHIGELPSKVVFEIDVEDYKDIQFTVNLTSQMLILPGR